MPDFEYYQMYLQAALSGAERYLLSDNLFQNMSVLPASARNYPNLTIGSLLLYEKYAQALAHNGSEKVSFQKIETQIENLQFRWRVAWERKTAREFGARLRQWGNALKEVREDPAENTAYFRYEVRTRVVLDLLKAENKAIEAASLEHLARLDLLLQALFSQGEFIWEPEFRPAFPRDSYWYLWGQPAAP